MQQLMRSRTNYALNDFDDNFSMSDAADLSMMNESFVMMRAVGGIPFIESGMALPPTSQVMREMAASQTHSVHGEARATEERRNSN